MAEQGAKHPGGRPREHNREQIFADLIEWAKKPDSINLNAFCCSREPPMSATLLMDMRREKPEFTEAYEAAKAFLAVRREAMLSAGALHQAAYNRNATAYDRFTKAEEKETLDEEMERKKKLQESAPQYSHNDMIQLDAFKKAIESYREKKD